MKKRFLLLMTILILSCNSDKNRNGKQKIIEPIDNKEIVSEQTVEPDNFQNIFTQDPTVEKKGRFNYLTISNQKENDSIVALCTCQKNVKNNLIKIQLKTGIPTKSELDTLKKGNRKGNKILEMGGFDSQATISGQFKFLTIVLQDSMVNNINLYSKSTEKEYNKADFDSMSIEKYHINISKMDYSVASDIYGNFLLRLPSEFGYFKNDTILKGSFECYNWRISDKESIKNWEINEWYKNKEANRGFHVVE